MAAQFTPTLNPRPTGPDLSRLALVLLFGGLLRQAAILLSGLLCAFLGELLGALPSLILAAIHAHQAHAHDGLRLFVCFHILASSGAAFYCLAEVI